MLPLDDRPPGPAGDEYPHHIENDDREEDSDPVEIEDVGEFRLTRVGELRVVDP